MIGAFVGMSIYTFRYAEGLSYFSKDPKACINCHIMPPQYESWQKASHHAVASCVECHLPQNTIEKYIAKVDNGYRHSQGLTFKDFNEPIMISKRNSKILQENCLKCHSSMVHGLAPSTKTDISAMSCVHCHSSVGHGERMGMGRFEKQEFLEGVKNE